MQNDINVSVSLETQKRLAAWGNWCRQAITMGLYYHSRSLISHLIENKGVMIATTQKMIMSTHPEAEEIEELVWSLSKMASSYAMQAKVLYIHYVSEDSKHKKAKKAGCTIHTYYQLLKNAEKWIETHLN